MPTAAEALYPNGPSNQLGNEYPPVKKEFPETKLKSSDWKSLSEDEQWEIRKNAAKILGIGEGYPETADDIEALLDEHGSIRIHDQAPAVLDWLKRANPVDYERYDMNEFGGRYSKEFSGETMIIRKKKAYTS